MESLTYSRLNSFCDGVWVQSTALAFEEVTEVNVYTCTGQPLPTDIAMIVEWMLNESYATAYQSQCFSDLSCLIETVFSLVPPSPLPVPLLQ